MPIPKTMYGISFVVLAGFIAGWLLLNFFWLGLLFTVAVMLAIAKGVLT